MRPFLGYRAPLLLDATELEALGFYAWQRLTLESVAHALMAKPA